MSLTVNIENEAIVYEEQTICIECDENFIYSHYGNVKINDKSRATNEYKLCPDCLYNYYTNF